MCRAWWYDALLVLDVGVAHASEAIVTWCVLCVLYVLRALSCVNSYAGRGLVEGDDYECPKCLKQLGTSVSARVNHVKACSKKTPQQLAAARARVSKRNQPRSRTPPVSRAPTRSTPTNGGRDAGGPLSASSASGDNVNQQQIACQQRLLQELDAKIRTLKQKWAAGYGVVW